MRTLLLIFCGALAACGGSGGSGGTTAPPAPGTTPVFDVQGSGDASPLDGQSVTVEGVVGGDFQEHDADTARDLGGFYIQGPTDNDPTTSDGVFVFDGDSPATDVNVGDRVRVEGTVVEYFGETQINAGCVAVIGSGTVQPVPVDLPAIAVTVNSDGDSIADLERYEGMLVRFPQSLTVSQLRNLERFGEILLNAGGRQYSYTNLNPPDPAGYATYINSLAATRVLLDDGRRDENPGGTPLQVRNGDEVSGLTGVLRYSRGSGAAGDENWRLMPTETPVFNTSNPRPAAPAVAGENRVASFNLLNWFSTIDAGADVCGPTGDLGCRGADNVEEQSRQLEKIVTTISMLNADIVGLVEIENNSRASLQTIVDALNVLNGPDTWRYVDTGVIGGDAIKVGLVYRPAAMHTIGAYAILDSSVDARFDDRRSRPVLAQTFRRTLGTAQLTVAVNHLKSKGSSCDAVGDPDRGDGQGNCSATRAAAATAMLDWLAADPTSSGDSDILIIGDFNAHTMEDAMAVFTSGGYVNVAETVLGAGSYSFEFDGQLGSLDHALASPGLAPQVVDAAEWHINADEASWHDYNLEFGRDPAAFDPASPYRTSDHDPLIIGFDLAP